MGMRHEATSWGATLLAGALAAGMAAARADTPLPAGEYLLTVSRPGSTLNIIDTGADRIARQCDLGVGPGSGTLVLSPDKQVAYVLANHFGDVYGVALDSCEVVFSTQQSTDEVRVKSLASVTVSPDGKRLYTHQNRVRLLKDRYQLLEPVIAEFDTGSGLHTVASRTLPAPRQITIMDRLEDGRLILGGQDVFLMDPVTGATEILIRSLHHEDPAFAPRDVLTVWPMGSVNNEFIRLYSTARWGAAVGDLDSAEWLWGYERVDLATGETESPLFGPLEVVLFSGARRPQHRNEMYAVLNHLKVYDIERRTELRSIPVDHAFYTLSFTADGSKLYLLGADAEVAVYHPETLAKLAGITLPGDGAMSNGVIFTRE